MYTPRHAYLYSCVRVPTWWVPTKRVFGSKMLCSWTYVGRSVVKHVISMLRALKLILRTPNKTKQCKPVMVALACISTWEAERNRSSRPWVATQCDWGQPGLWEFFYQKDHTSSKDLSPSDCIKEGVTNWIFIHPFSPNLDEVCSWEEPPNFLAYLRHKDQQPEIELCWCVWIWYVCSHFKPHSDSHYHSVVEETVWRDGMVGTQFWFYTVGKPDLHPLGLLPHLWKEKLGCIWIPSALHVLFQFVSVTKDFELGRGRMPIHQTTNSLK